MFLEKGFENVRLKEIADAASVEIIDVYKYFGNTGDIILLLYQRINADWEIFVAGLIEPNLSVRFEKALLRKIELIAPYSALLSDLMSLLLKKSDLGVRSARTRHIRIRGIRIMQKLSEGSSSRFLKNNVKSLPELLYVIHWGILFLHVQSGDLEKTKEIIKVVCKMLKRGGNFLLLLPMLPLVKDLTKLSQLVLEEPLDKSNPASRQILNVIFNHRKISGFDKNCLQTNCEICIEKHLSEIEYFVSTGQPIHFILPAFPAKSPNKSKVLGELPDLGEETALITLENMCDEIADAYPPGARVTICSDGRIFAELVGVTDKQVTKYAEHLQKMIDRLHLKNIDIINLEDLLPDKTFDQARKFVIEKYAEETDVLQKKLKSDEEFKQLFNGIHRFISEDRIARETEKSKTKVKEESKPVALKVIQHSNAWTRFLSYYFPESVRLSIHPYSSHADKIGIKLTKAIDNWITPWHGVMVLTEDGYLLMKREQAEKQNAKLILKNGEPYYYSLIAENE